MVGGIASSAGVVTSAAFIMVAVFSIFATLSLIDLKILGVGMAAAVLIDATIVRGILLPAALALLGDRTWAAPRWLRRRGRSPANPLQQLRPGISGGRAVLKPSGQFPFPHPQKRALTRPARKEHAHEHAANRPGTLGDYGRHTDRTRHSCGGKKK